MSEVAANVTTHPGKLSWNGPKYKIKQRRSMSKLAKLAGTLVSVSRNERAGFNFILRSALA